MCMNQVQLEGFQFATSGLVINILLNTHSKILANEYVNTFTQASTRLAMTTESQITW